MTSFLQNGAKMVCKLHWLNRLSKIKLIPLQYKNEKLGLNFVDTDLNYETFLGNTKCWCCGCGHLNSVYILLGHPVY